MVQPTEHVDHPVTRLRPSTCNITREALEMTLKMTIGPPANVTLTGSPACSYCAGIMPPDAAITTSTTSAVPPAPTAAPGPAYSKASGPGEVPVIFFDGICGLCNHWVDFVVARDRQRQFRFAPLQGETARDWLHLTPDEALSSVILCDGTGIHRKSDAVWRIFARLGGVWLIAGGLLRIIPRPLRTWGYDFVARHRYRWFGQKQTCRLPSAEERERFLP
jgi:predicted DCC family thiol-disulfide oxidoreductase YuxK